MTIGLTGWMLRSGGSAALGTVFSASFKSVRVTPCQHTAKQNSHFICINIFIYIYIIATWASITLSIECITEHTLQKVFLIITPFVEWTFTSCVMNLEYMSLTL